MKIGVVIYSLSGHTRSVAKRLEQALSTAGHTVTVEEIETVGPVKPGMHTAELVDDPDVEAYEGLVLGVPVWGGHPASPMRAYLEQVESLSGKRVACLTTGFFPFANWGRNQTLTEMAEACEVRGAEVVGSESVGWLSLSRRRQIDEAVDAISKLF
jgi:flavodoxin